MINIKAIIENNLPLTVAEYGVKYFDLEEYTVREKMDAVLLAKKYSFDIEKLASAEEDDDSTRLVVLAMAFSIMLKYMKLIGYAPNSKVYADDFVYSWDRLLTDDKEWHCYIDDGSCIYKELACA